VSGVEDWTKWRRRVFRILMVLAFLPSTAPNALPAERWQGLTRLAHANLPISLRESCAGNAVDAAIAEVRALRLYHIHTGESLTITYKRDGRYIPSAMAQLDYFLRDWRTNGFVSMSGETIDLMWELHEELGSKRPINIISGFRSAQTNALLKHIGRRVATRSEHILGRAIDIQFPDVPVERLRNSALMRQAGGVGYYPARSGGFVHIDSGQVRHWPWISKTELAKIFAAHSGSSAMRDQQAAAPSRLAAAQQNTSSPPLKSADWPLTNSTRSNVTATNTKASTTNRGKTRRDRSGSHRASTETRGIPQQIRRKDVSDPEGARARASKNDRNTHQASWVQKLGALAAAPAGAVQPPTAQITAAAHVTQAARARAQIAQGANSGRGRP
jgi:uncharacterized protein YcbK (DUF882 family)